MIDVHIIDSRGVYLRTESIDPKGPQPKMAVYTAPPDAVVGYTRLWNGQLWLRVLDSEVPTPAEPAEPVPVEVPRWAGRLALKRHVLEGGDLRLLGPDESSASNLLQLVYAWRATLQGGELADRVDEALDSAKDWVRHSDTLQVIGQVLNLGDAQIDQLFIWAGKQRV